MTRDAPAETVLIDHVTGCRACDADTLCPTGQRLARRAGVDPEPQRRYQGPATIQVPVEPATQDVIPAALAAAPRTVDWSLAHGQAATELLDVAQAATELLDLATDARVDLDPVLLAARLPRGARPYAVVAMRDGTVHVRWNTLNCVPSYGADAGVVILSASEARTLARRPVRPQGGFLP